MQWFMRINHLNGLNARADINCGRNDVQTDGWKTGCLFRTLLKHVR